MRISAAELLSRTRDFTPEERARLDAMTDEEIEKAAFTDPDAQPSTAEMLRRGQENRQRRLFSEGQKKLGVTLSEAEPDLDLPTWEITDQHGRTVLIKAAEIHRVASSTAASKVLKLEAVDEPSASAAAPER